ncbi:tetratricopeptide repeat protein [Lysobacter sp. BMK333-48F3]|uniref:tetratricopeptide repeat protein n=1 Tax=Lysobacter sp. BMK333-48F3 TaxID=2867962 RepID=UPI001C8C7EC4|nr:tetratricopeptide repeat protein [Lysobacter sp. BMK333-48F3]MBX9401848.1 tetratricopeptide repeat protein [Lysobacter sp. BMK333-48F3]
MSATVWPWNELYWLRPQFLWLLLALPALAWWWRRRRRDRSVWRGAVDAHLLPHLLDGRAGRASRLAAIAAALGYAIAVLALSGPSWRESEQPLWQTRTPLVLALDLSSRTLAGDLPPSRLAQARAKLAALLRQRDGGQIGLVVYADDAYTVAPLTDDPRNVAIFLDALAPEIMPGDGQRADRAIAWSARLLRQAGFDRGEILLITDHADRADRAAADQAREQGYRVSALGLGGDTATPFRRPDGEIVSVALDADSLRRLASDGGGRYASIGQGDADLRALGVLTAKLADTGTQQGKQGMAREDNGCWLLPPLLLLGLFAFRRRSGAAALALLLCLGLPLAPARAQGLWQRADQAAHARIEEGTAAYRKGEFERAGELYRQGRGADAQYNLGNALARQGRYDEAIQAYDQALKLQPGMADALANRRAVAAAKKRPPPPKGEAKQNAPRQDGGGQSGQGAQGGRSGNQDPKPQPARDGKQDGQPEPSPAGERKPAQPQQQPQPQQKPQPQPSAAGNGAGAAPRAADRAAQQRADAAQRERIQRELERQARDGASQRGGRKAPAAGVESTQQREHRLANDAWLKRLPDEPGELLREKFKIEYERRQMQSLRGD